MPSCRSIRRRHQWTLGQSEKLVGTGWMDSFTRNGISVAQVSMPQGSYKLSMLERDIEAHVANIDRWGVREG